MQESGQLNFIQRPEGDFLEKSELGFGIFFADGHTEKQMIPHIQYKDKTIVFCADLLSTAGHIPIPYVMGYDTRPLLTMPEKEKFMNEPNHFMFFWAMHTMQSSFYKKPKDSLSRDFLRTNLNIVLIITPFVTKITLDKWHKLTKTFS
jgi:hypothetical protein